MWHNLLLVSEIKDEILRNHSFFLIRQAFPVTVSCWLLTMGYCRTVLIPNRTESYQAVSSQWAEPCWLGTEPSRDVLHYGLPPLMFMLQLQDIFSLSRLHWLLSINFTMPTTSYFTIAVGDGRVTPTSYHSYIIR